jgi:hypothetical protein
VRFLLEFTQVLDRSGLAARFPSQAGNADYVTKALAQFLTDLDLRLVEEACAVLAAESTFMPTAGDIRRTAAVLAGAPTWEDSFVECRRMAAWCRAYHAGDRSTPQPELSPASRRMWAVYGSSLVAEEDGRFLRAEFRRSFADAAARDDATQRRTAMLNSGASRELSR